MSERMTLEQMIVRLTPALIDHINRSVARHGGKLPATIERAALIVSEEAGELAEAVLDATRGDQITEEQFHELDNNIIVECRDVLAAALIFLMAHTGMRPAPEEEIGEGAWEVPDGQRVM